MRKITKMISMFLLGALLLSSFISCAVEPSAPPENTTETIDDDPNTDPKYLELKALLRGKLSDFQIVRSDSMKDAETKTVLSFRQALVETSSTDIKVVTDFEYSYPRQDKEIVIGTTNLEPKYFTLPDASKTLTEGAYAIDVIGDRVILSYSDQEGMMEGLEFLLFAMVKGSEDDLKTAFSDALNSNGLQRFSGFSLNNYFMDGMKLSAGSELLCFGTAEVGKTVSVRFCKDQQVLRSAETKADEDGNWQLKIAPEMSANLLSVHVDGVRVRKYENISCVGSALKSPDSGMRIYINGVEQKALVTDAGTQVIASLPDANTTSMEVVVQYPHKSVDIRPLNENVQAISNNNEVRFTVNSFPKKLSVELDGSISKSVQLFLYPYDDTDVTKLDSNVIYFAPGEYILQSKIALRSNDTLYLEEGAVVHAHVSAENAENISIMGRGVIDTYPLAETNMITLDYCKDVLLKDFTLIGARKWMVRLFESQNCTVSAMNILGTQINSDGVDIVGCQDVTVEHSYLRNNDDCIAVKSYGSNVSNIRIIGNVFFNDVYGNALEIGYETRCDTISNVVFEDNDIIHILGGAVFSIHIGDRANVSNVQYRNIRVEDCDMKLVEFFVKETQYTVDETRGSIKDISFENISIEEDALGKVIFSGFDADHQVNNINFRNVVCGGRLVDSSAVRFETNSYVSNVIWNNIQVK